MRKGFEGLYGLVRDRLQCEPLSGHVFLFCNAQRNRLKLLVWDGSGLWICAKKLSKGRFRWPEPRAGEVKVVLSHEELAMLLGGIEKYGAGSEKLSNLQLEMLEQEPGVSPAEVQAESERPVIEGDAVEVAGYRRQRRPHPGRQSLPAELPRVERVIACPAEQCVC